MPDIIQQLPDHLANQIAAGEVIQRPASAVKELLENAIDAGANDIQLIIKEAGKALIQVVDNGKGMSPMDARMCFERHATSKINKIEDLFSIHTMGFRGEALASIAAVAQVELKTKRQEDESGTWIIIEESKVLQQEPTAHPNGTSIAIKNLFYNVPARRKFLKSDTTEYKNILDEFVRIAMANPQIAFRLYHNNTEQINLPSGNLKSRIKGLLESPNKPIEKRIIPIEEHTEFVKIYGFIGKPEAAKKTRGDQYFFVNNRFIKSPYLHHAVGKAYDGLIEKDAFPFYVIFFEIDPSRVDVNVHPTKQEVKFEDDQMLYAYMQTAVKHALSKYNIAPSIDFTINPEIYNAAAVRIPQNDAQKEEVTKGYLYSTFTQQGNAHLIERSNALRDWKNQKEQIFDKMQGNDNMDFATVIPSKYNNNDTPIQQEFNIVPHSTKHNVIQWNDYIISTMKSGVLVLHQKRALERIIYEKLERRLHNATNVSQQMLFPATLQFSAADAVILENMLSDLYSVGYDISSLGNNTYCLQGAPSDLQPGTEQSILEEIIEQIKNESTSLKTDRQNRLIRTMAKRQAHTELLSQEEAIMLIDELFACSQPQYTPDGYKIFNTLQKESIENLL